MLIKALPGLGIALALAVFFTMSADDAAPSLRRADVARRSPSKRRDAPLPFLSATDSAHRPSPLAVRETAPESDAVANPIFTGMTVTARPVDASAAAPRGVDHRQPAPIISNSALASVQYVDECAEPEPVRGLRRHYMELPPKGIYLWGDVDTTKAKMDEFRTGVNAFDVDAKTYTLGLKYDWSLDAIVGLSISRLHHEVSSRHHGDSRRASVDGTIFTGHFDGYVLGKYPLSVKAFYGDVDTKSDGALSGGRYSWKEDKHGSDYFGFSAVAGLPLIFRDQYKMLVELGVDYKRLKSDAYSIGVAGDTTFAAAARTSESLLIPLDFTFRKDFAQLWGIVTPYVGAGLAVELKDSAAALRAWNASAASAVAYTPGYAPGYGAMNRIAYDAWTSALGRIRLGVEAKTVGGWEMRAGYAHVSSNGYSENSFSLELGRCF